MKTSYKRKFNKAAHKSSDIPSRKAVLKFLNKVHGMDFYEPSNKFSIDLRSDSLRQGIELESRAIWSDKFPYPTVHLPERKDYIFLFPKANWYPSLWVLNSDFTKALVIDQSRLVKYIKPECLVTLKCRGRYEDKFYEIPLSEFKGSVH